MKIAPSILSGDFAYLGDAVKQAQEGGADYIHIDVMDGHFVPNITIGPQSVAAIKKYTSLPLDVHLMIENPDFYAERFIKAGADILTIHVEAALHLHRSIQNIKKHNILCGVSLNPATAIESLEYVIPDIDLILIMTVNPGFGGQEFIPQMIEKIKKTKTIIDNSNKKIILEVDGGVNAENIGRIAQAGADICVAGASVFTTGDVKKAIADLKKQSVFS